jgi:hypothetical protein
MGNWNSVENKDQIRNDAIFDIETTGNKLNREYTEKYLDPDFCNRVTMINNDDLIRFRHQEVDNKTYSFGYIGDAPQMKDTICEGIQEEYRLKKELVSVILDCFKDCNARIDSITRGPSCRGNPEAFNEADCTPPSEWIRTVVPPDEAVPDNENWYSALDEYHNYFMKHLTILQNILHDLEDHDDRFSIDRVQEMTRNVNKIKISIRTECAKLQRHMLTIPTFTEQEVLERQKIQAENQQRTNAKRAALLNGSDVSI